MTPVELHSDVYNEIEAAKNWYNEKAAGLGNRFLREIDHGLECIRNTPDSWPVHICNTRRFFLNRFPFAIVYKFDGEIIRVFALMHLRREPGYWRKRLI